MRFKVKVNDGGLADGTRIVNYGTASFRSETLQQPGSVRTPDAVTVVRVPDVTIVKTRNGDFEVGEYDAVHARGQQRRRRGAPTAA